MTEYSGVDSESLKDESKNKFDVKFHEQTRVLQQRLQDILLKQAPVIAALKREVAKIKPAILAEDRELRELSEAKRRQRVEGELKALGEGRLISYKDHADLPDDMPVVNNLSQERTRLSEIELHLSMPGDIISDAQSIQTFLDQPNVPASEKDLIKLNYILDTESRLEKLSEFLKAEEMELKNKPQ